MPTRPIEELWLRPAATFLLCVALPILFERALRALLGKDRDLRAALRLTTPASLLFAALAGATALAPSFEDGERVATLVFVAGCVTGLLAARHRRVPVDRGEALAVTAGLALGVAANAFSLGPLGVVAGVAMLLADVAHAGWTLRREVREGLAIHAAASAGLGAFLLALTVAAALLTRIDPDRAAFAGEDAASWRLRVDPADPTAMLAAAWGARERDAFALAHARAEEAARLGAEPGPVLELEAEVLAAEGRCDEARATFDEALRARAASLFDEDDAALADPLTLGGYQLPPALIEECGGL